MTTFAGSGSYGLVDGRQGVALFSNPKSIAVDRNGSVYTVDVAVRVMTSTVIGKLASAIVTLATLSNYSCYCYFSDADRCTYAHYHPQSTIQ